ncbi:hypothetical protein OAS39_03875 [Pirellulales bacterium]|nr:hypothetical protein [Pirellulales bacterium]
MRQQQHPFRQHFPSQHPSPQQEPSHPSHPPSARRFFSQLKQVSPEPPSPQGQTTFGTQTFSHSISQQCFSTFSFSAVPTHTSHRLLQQSGPHLSHPSHPSQPPTESQQQLAVWTAGFAFSASDAAGRENPADRTSDAKNIRT